MIVHDVQQGSDDWYQARLGIPTASCFDKIVTTQGKKSTQSAAYMHKLIAERMTGQRTQGYTSAAMDTGTEREPEARDYLAFQLPDDLDVREAGIVYKDGARAVAASPDGLIYREDEIVEGSEIKCPEAHTHISYLIGAKLPTKYVMQVQGSMWVTDLPRWRFLSYFPGLPPFLTTVERDPAVMQSLDKYVSAFVADLEAAHLALAA